MTGHELAMALRKAYLAMHRRTDAAMAPAGVTADQFVALDSLAAAGSLTQKQLATRTATDPNTLRAMLLLLERQGLVARKPHPADGRARSVTLTPAGRTVHRKLWRASESLRAEMLARLAEPEVAKLVALLGRFAAAMESGGPRAKATGAAT
ncbi:MAG TPA: MarR family transcriptional regulator [Planctomycetia bacterium]|nr:MarR family transcriptional regulator [Planctomycetia bacterium]